MEPTQFCKQCNNVKQYCKKDLGDHDHLNCNDCTHIHWTQACSFGKELCDPDNEQSCGTYVGCECCCRCI
jgi:hypothetical protein